jgi:hypothetical protein
MPIDYEGAREILREQFREAEDRLLTGRLPVAPGSTEAPFETVFASSTQAYREALLGCCIARIQDKLLNIRLPYINQGGGAFNGRTLDERVVNPFLQANRIPGSRGPYLGVFRRSVRFDESTWAGLRDKSGYDAFLDLIAYLEDTGDNGELIAFARYLLYKFAVLREAHAIPLSRLHRISLEQYDALISGLLTVPSGGRLPVLLVVATFLSIKEFFDLDWAIDYQGINVADMAAGAGGDITISKAGQVLMSAEITERDIDPSRVAATFNTKIAPKGIEDYLFFVRLAGVDPHARELARQYFAQGHEVNFIEIKEWILMSLATMGRQGRDTFNKTLTTLLDAPEIPRNVKVGWNTQIAELVGN